MNLLLFKSFINKKIKGSSQKSYFRITFLNYIFSSLSILVSFLYIPLLVEFLGKEKFGIWQTFLSIISFGSLLNFGLGNGLRNIITQLKVNDKFEEIGTAIGATFKQLIKIISGIGIILVLVSYYVIDWSLIFANTTVSLEEIKISIVIFISFFMLNIILNVSNSIAFGLQKSYLTGITQFSYLFICYVAVFIYGNYGELDLINLSFIFGGVQSTVYLVMIFIQNKVFNLNINFQEYNLKETSSLAFKFFIVQILSLLYVSADNLVISSSMGPNFTAEYSILNKIFFAIISFFSILLIQFWNSVTEAYEKKDIKWINKGVFNLHVACFLFFIVALAISTFQSPLIDIWLQEDTFKFSSLSFYLFSVYLLVHCLNAIYVNLQNGIGDLKLQMISWSIGLIIYILGLTFLDLSEYGYNLLIILKIISLSIILLINRLILRKIKQNLK